MPRRVAALLVRLLAVVVLIASSVYLLVYLYRWEWNRALVAGMFVLAAELAVIGGNLSRRLRSVERILDEQARHDRERRIRERLDAAPAPRSVRFEWLREPPEGLGVFVPVLLGAGAVLSAAAYVVERLAVLTTDPLLQRDVAARLSRLQLPEGGFLPGPGGPPVGAASDGDLELRPPSGRHLVPWVLILLVGSLLTAGLVAGIANVTQARDEPDRSGAQTGITLEVENRTPGVTPTATFELLWGACRARAPGAVEVERVVPAGADTVQITLDHGLGRTSARKLGGCLEDGVIDLVRARIVEMVVLPKVPGELPVDPRWQDPTP